MTNEPITIPGTSIDLGHLTTFLESLYGMPKVGLVLIFCTSLCLWLHFVIKKLPFVPNYVIPIAVPCVVPFTGAILLVCCQSFQDSKIKSFSSFIFINGMIGFISGTAATFIYYFAALPAIRKFKPRTNGGDETVFVRRTETKTATIEVVDTNKANETKP